MKQSFRPNAIVAFLLEDNVKSMPSCMVVFMLLAGASILAEGQGVYIIEKFSTHHRIFFF